MTDAAVVLLGHGSRDPEGAAEFLAVAAAMRAALPGVPVEAGVLEFPGPVAPSIPEAFERALASGARRILAVPALLHFGVHGTADMPRQVAAARERHPAATIRLARPLHGHDALLPLLADRCATAEATLAHVRTFSHAQARRDSPTDASATVLLVGRGTTSPRANADLHATARLFQERGPYGAVEVCFVSLAPPCVPAGLRRCVALGARRVLVVPYFVNTGLLVRRIATQVHATRLFYPHVEVAVAPHFGPEPRLIAALVDRARETWPEVVEVARGGEPSVGTLATSRP